MPLSIPYSFDRFISNISLAGDQVTVAETRRARIVELLAKQFEIIDSFPSGSMMRGTALHGKSDLDLFLVLHYGKHVKGKSPRQLLEGIRDALSGYNNKLTKKNGQAVTLYFTAPPSVDVVPVNRVVDAQNRVTHYSVPDMITGQWLTARPRSHDGAMAAVSEGKRRLVRMIKIWNRAHSSLLQSYHIEVMALSMPEITGSWPFEVRYFFEAAYPLLSGPIVPPDAAAGIADAYLTEADRAETRKRVATAWSWARDAEAAVNNANHREATRLYRLIFGDDFPAYG